jgi:signal transduction histidine kinase
MNSSTPSSSAPSRRVPLPFWAWCVLALVCTALYTSAVPITSAVYEMDLVVAFALSTVQCGSLILAVFRPRLAAVLHLAAITALAVATRDSNAGAWPLPVTGLISSSVLLVILGIRERWVVSVVAWWASIAALIALIASTPARYADPDQWGTNLTVFAAGTAAVLVASIALGQRRRIRADLAQARRDMELEQAQRLYVEERARIARELHDVVAHSMSLIHMQAMSAPIRLRGSDRTAVDAEFGDIASSARSALGEMRQLLGALRSDDHDPDLVPQPRLSDIDELARATARAGLDVDVEIATPAATATSIVQLTIYRLVQEALSNVVRHAPGAATTVEVATQSTSLRVTVQNEPSPAAARAGARTSPDEGGHGLRGMRERVTLVGGELTTRPTAEGGFLVQATFPNAFTPERGTR